jgi:hypothetical protein
MPDPSVGNIVHYVSHGTPVRPDGSQEYPSACRAAIIAEVIDLGDISQLGNPEDLPMCPVVLCVLNPAGLFFCDAEQDENDHAGGTWHWPGRV